MSVASPANALEPWVRFEPSRPEWVEVGSSPRAKFFIDQNEMQIDGAVVWAFERAVYTPGVKFFNPDNVIPDPKYSGPIKRAVFLLEFLCEHNTYREVNTTYWYENGETWNSGYPNLLAHGQIDIDNPIFQYMANFACAKRKAAATTPVPTIAAPTPPASASAVPPSNVPNVIPPSQVPIPTPGRIVDLSNVMSEDKKEAITARSQAIERAWGMQVAALVLPTTGGEPIDAYSIRVANVWKLGRVGINDGVLIVIATQDRRVQIEVGKGIEEVIPDQSAGQVIARMKPLLQAADYAGAIRIGMDDIAGLRQRFSQASVNRQESP